MLDVHFFFFKQKTAYEMRISDWSSDVCSSDLLSTSDDMPEPLSPDRFNEEKAAYTVRGAGQPDLETGIAAIRETLKTLPPRPGVYRMQDARGDVLYVGKADRKSTRLNSSH